jgi:hypothetical protein
LHARVTTEIAWCLCSYCISDCSTRVLKALPGCCWAMCFLDLIAFRKMLFCGGNSEFGTWPNLLINLLMVYSHVLETRSCTALISYFIVAIYSYVWYFMRCFRLSLRKHFSCDSVPFLPDVTFKKNVDFYAKVCIVPFV